ncbi:UNVERIFIED_CONTAM: hypothetical protein Sangu_1642000 [Sesamum angustifolium]|uniref:Uncharacterized protein n=1 Tax=Sesamum angustifolium TaxID=2727405 RepID=A0AAW2MI16_9LAMI
MNPCALSTCQDTSSLDGSDIFRLRRKGVAVCYPANSVVYQVKRLLDEGMDVNVAAWGPKSHGVTLFHLAAKRGHLKVMDELLERGANIDARN